MLSRRIIPCLDVRDGRVVKGVRFRDHVDMGDIVELALRYRDAGADELVFYDIGASPEGRSVDHGWVQRVASLLDIPFCVAGGIRDVDTARAVLNSGADKISINTPALERPQLIAELAEAFGEQCVVVGIDSIREPDGQWRVRSYTGDPAKTRDEARLTLDWLREAQQREQQAWHGNDDLRGRYFGTVGAVALDSRGHVAAATSTGGMTNKRWGRVGDSPVIGAGTWADARCAVSCSGWGEFYIRNAAAHDIAARVAYRGDRLRDAVEDVILGEVPQHGGDGGAIAVDTEGNVSLVLNTRGMYRGWVRPDGARGTAIYQDA